MDILYNPALDSQGAGGNQASPLCRSTRERGLAGSQPPFSSTSREGEGHLRMEPQMQADCEECFTHGAPARKA